MKAKDFEQKFDENDDITASLRSNKGSQQGVRSRVENITDELGIVLFNGLVTCASPVSDS